MLISLCLCFCFGLASAFVFVSVLALAPAFVSRFRLCFCLQLPRPLPPRPRGGIVGILGPENAHIQHRHMWLSFILGPRIPDMLLRHTIVIASNSLLAPQKPQCSLYPLSFFCPDTKKDNDRPPQVVAAEPPRTITKKMSNVIPV